MYIMKINNICMDILNLTVDTMKEQDLQMRRYCILGWLQELFSIGSMWLSLQHQLSGIPLKAAYRSVREVAAEHHSGMHWNMKPVHVHVAEENKQSSEGWWLSGCRSSVAQYWLHKPGVLGSIPGGFRPFHFPLFSPQIHLISLHSNVRHSSK